MCVCRSCSGLRDMFCNLNRQPRVGINILRLAVDQREMFISAACDALIRALIYLTREVLPSTRARGVRCSGAGNHPAQDPANQSIGKLHQDKGIKIPGFLISLSYFIIIDLKLAERYQAAAGS